MTIVVHPKLAPRGKARFWVGVFGRAERPNAPPRLRFAGHGAGMAPTVLRPLSAFRAGELAGQANERKVFTGVFEFPARPEQGTFTLRVGVEGEPAEGVAATSPLPEQLPLAPGTAFNVLLTSCYYHKGEHAHAFAETLTALPATLRPQLTLFLGDQVYLDLPTFSELRNDAAELAKVFEERYSNVWQGPYGSAFRCAPSTSIPDDHEFWNNYPSRFFAVQNTWSAEGRRRWKAAASGAFSAFQLGDANPQGTPVVFDVPPLSFFIADTRSARDDQGRRWTLGPGGVALAKLRAWAESAIAKRLFPVFVAGQSLLDRPGDGVDRTLPDYADYPLIMAELGKLSSHGRCPLLITGDVHYGRLAFAVDASSGRPRAFEVIASPAALVDTVGLDQLNDLFRTGPWPRHPKPGQPPKAVQAGQGRWDLHTAHGQRGNHVAILSFRRFAGSVQFKVTYCPVHSRPALRKPTELAWVNLESRG